VNRRAFLLTLAAAPVLLRDDPAAFARRLGGTPLALVTADEEGHVIAVELGGGLGRVYTRIPTLAGPRSIQTVGGSVVIAHTSEGAVTLLDAVTLKTRKLLRGFEEPRYTAGSRDGRYAYVSDSGRAEVVVVDLPAARIVTRIPVGGPARHLSSVHATGELWVALGTKAERLAILDLANTRRPRLVRTVDPPFLAHDVGFQGSRARVWITSGAEHALAIYDARTRRLVRRLPSGAPPQHVTFSRGAAYVTSGDDGTLRVHSLSSGKVVRTSHVPIGSYNVQEAANLVLTPSLARGTLCVLDRRGRIVKEERVASSSHDACYVFAA
jgi:DNA-binding beta-propeller fold protein YncE